MIAMLLAGMGTALPTYPLTVDLVHRPPAIELKVLKKIVNTQDSLRHLNILVTEQLLLRSKAALNSASIWVTLSIMCLWVTLKGSQFFF